ncbi:MnhB domain-containing protein [Salipiger marinus]|uniref:Multisubunit sodium/proton antiporter, MrpB subunit (TC 2.A.63.1) n=1 Tax=Salipiger marinus TaxID=555512 RepID=A0A1G8SPL9_9RHOB|nr:MULTISPECIES: MnhB domain-containing protein [Salipiger]MEB3420694.1 MnhB domain-containing protein [Salipiger manganoxidans]SDJ30685.1 multisubunit sodium/proton antiporter, MrpB subunit (TC 2.A.63.1) [Salipiger marinus]HBM57843.1 Na(+)/H(+) antiporter subunit B [Citreicella sp.]HBT02066.1 Na(+)/H(+) antiporter subunit B [Citreicella sp.]
MNSLILSVATRYLTGLLLVFSIYLLLRGHNEPGGGFIGGLTGATGFILQAMANGTDRAREALRLPPEVLAMLGLGAALLAGLMSALTGDAFLTGQWLFLGAEDGGKGLPLSSVLVFDIGVYLVVFGAVLTLVFEMEEHI